MRQKAVRGSDTVTSFRLVLRPDRAAKGRNVRLQTLLSVSPRQASPVETIFCTASQRQKRPI